MILKVWRKEVFCGEEDPSEKTDSGSKLVFQTWLNVAKEFKERAEFYRRHDLPIDREVSCAIDRQIGEATVILRDWFIPSRSLSPALCTRELSAASEAKLELCANQGTE
jgi:hypothetical protein